MSYTYKENRVFDKKVTPTITAGAYSANDVVGGLLEFPVDGTKDSGLIVRVQIVDAGNVKAACKLYLFTEKPNVIVDNGAFAPNRAAQEAMLGPIPVAAADYVTINSIGRASHPPTVSDNLAIPFKLGSAGILYGYLVCDATPTYIAINNLTIRIIGVLD